MRLLVEDNKDFSIREQCHLLEINRSWFYYRSKGESKANLEAMQLMDSHILREPTAGVITMQNMLEENGLKMSYERVRRLMRKAEIMPIYPRRMLTQKGENKHIYPYLLKGLEITKPNQVWQIDITYIPMKNGFMYMTAIIDVYSRFIVGWGLSNSLEAMESLKILKDKGYPVRFQIIGCKPDLNEEWVDIIPFLNKNYPQELQEIQSHLLKSHFLFVPTKADCTPIAFCEAAGYGLPVISTNTGGISAHVVNGETGILLPESATATDYAVAIEKLLQHPEMIRSMSIASREKYKKELNWKVWE
ncbi:glycosyltransferase, partial [Neisseria sicca]|uniref:glycosyltransferase n=1 Tax=Neisseria sicca TaxID=490 RepID=UPI003617DBB8